MTTQEIIEEQQCPTCEGLQDVVLTEYPCRIKTKGLWIDFYSKSYKCRLCGDVFDTGYTMECNLSVARRTYNTQKGCSERTKNLALLLSGFVEDNGQ